MKKNMQTKKEHIRNHIAVVAKRVFLEKGFAKTSMRDIANESGVGLGNLYNYFMCKNELFKYIVSPLIMDMNKMLQEHYNERYSEQFLNFADGDADAMIVDYIKAYIRLIGNHQDELRLVMFKAQGSSLENFIDEYVERCTRQTMAFMEKFKSDHPHFGAVRTTFTYHIHTVWMFNFILEIVKQRLTPDEIEKAVNDYIEFEFIGWQNIINQQKNNKNEN